MSIRSMTGFGEAEAKRGGVTINVEMRSVNNRFLDANCKLPSCYSRSEHDVIRQVKAVLKRGRVDVYVTRTEDSGSDQELIFRPEVFDRYLDITKKALKRAGIKGTEALQQAVLDLLRRKEVLEMGSSEVDEKAEQELLQSAIEKALKNLIKMRELEGKALEKDLLKQLSQIESIVKTVKASAGKWPAAFQEKLTARLDRLGSGVEVDPQRLAQEVAILADKVDVTEELVRMESHIAQFRKVLKDSESGKKLEFLLQEMGREVNTTGSKAQNSEITGLVVEAKTLLEKIREQVLNIE